MLTELEQERRMAANDRFGDAAGETARRLEDMRRRRKREMLRNGMEVQSREVFCVAGHGHSREM